MVRGAMSRSASEHGCPAWLLRVCERTHALTSGSSNEINKGQDEEKELRQRISIKHRAERQESELRTSDDALATTEGNHLPWGACR